MMSIVGLNLMRHGGAQDMICLIEKEQGITVSEAIDFSINKEIHKRILDTGWGSIALPLWGHDEPERQWLKMNEPKIEIEMSDKKIELLHDIKVKEDVDTETAIAYFLLFTMEKMGYHI